MPDTETDGDRQIEFLREWSRVNRARIRNTYNPDADADMCDAIADRLEATRPMPVGERLPGFDADKFNDYLVFLNIPRNHTGGWVIATFVDLQEYDSAAGVDANRAELEDNYLLLDATVDRRFVWQFEVSELIEGEIVTHWLPLPPTPEHGQRPKGE